MALPLICNAFHFLLVLGFSCYCKMAMPQLLRMSVGKMTNQEIQREKIVQDIFTCGLEFAFNSSGLSANAIERDDGLLKCQIFNEIIPEEQLIDAANSTYIASWTMISRSCEGIRKDGGSQNGVYSITLSSSSNATDVYCDQTKGGGGWTVIQRRKDGSVNFKRNWEDYKNGFGSIDGEFWFGLNNIHELTFNGHNILRFDFWSNTEHIHATYKNVTIAGEEDDYRIAWSSFEGEWGDSMTGLSGMKFSTADHDRDGNPTWNCAIERESGFWFNRCSFTTPNGKYGSTAAYRGPVWAMHNGCCTPFPNVEIKLKPGN